MKKVFTAIKTLNAKWQGRDKGSLHGLSNQFVYGTQMWTMK